MIVAFGSEVSRLLVPPDGEVLPELKNKDDFYVVRCYPSTGIKRTVDEREQNIPSLDEATP